MENDKGEVFKLNFQYQKWLEMLYMKMVHAKSENISVIYNVD